MIKLKRAYEKPSRDDGFRILVERLWPRGVTKNEADLDLWLKDIAPSPELRKWYGHDVEKWGEFQKRYTQELNGKSEFIDQVKQRTKDGTVTFVYAARDEEHNSAIVLKEFVERS